MEIPLLQVRHVTKSFADPVLKDISFDVTHGEVLCVLGPSGCGKSTLLNIIAGLQQADVGEVLLEGQDITPIPVHRRGFGFMFQNLALFPHKNVYDNVAFGLRMAGLTAPDIQQRVDQTLELVGLAGFARRDVNQLSGGEQQRVALARSLCPRPRLLMLDEPLSSLDRTLRERLLDELRIILKRVGQTAIYVTHDQQEAFAVSDRILIINSGRIAQIGHALEIYRNPADTFVARFLGLNNLITGYVRSSESNVVDTSFGPLRFDGRHCQAGEVTVLIRPDALQLEANENQVDGKVVEQSFRGQYIRVSIKVADTDLVFDVDSSTTLPPQGSDFHFAVRPDAITCLSYP